ncbi:MAG TPA: hypothetical protein PKB10_10465, partial [Tepidisphaeraceae bacterium]|nr:hypothetical protein [Tepidisphaeraceae bacterium]
LGSPTTQPRDPSGAVNVVSDIVHLDLSAGTQQWTIQLEHAGQWINWIELTPAEAAPQGN